MSPLRPSVAPVSVPVVDVWTVSRLNREAKSILEGAFPLLWVEGEVSNFSCPRSGHWYFTLKDPAAQVRCAMFRNRNLGLRLRPTDGMQARIRARVSLYEGRGDFQLIAEHLEAAGDGALRRAFEATKARLAAEGLFDAARKRPVPAMPRAVGVVTSPGGAAVHDVLRVLRDRFPALPVVVYPAPVQGERAAAALARMLEAAAVRAEVDVLLLVRGGGSLEDLAAFNDVSLARAVAACPLPVVAGVGHEVDFTIVDFVADLRAATPSAAAEAVSPDGAALALRLAGLRRRLALRMAVWLRSLRQRLAQDAARLARRCPGWMLEGLAQGVDVLESRLRRAMQRELQRGAARLDPARRRLLQQHPRRRTALQRQRLAQFAARLRSVSPASGIRRGQERVAAAERRLRTVRTLWLVARSRRVAALARQLEAVSPLAVLGRGYAIVTGPDGAVLESAQAVAAGDVLAVRLKAGTLRVRVEPRLS